MSITDGPESPLPATEAPPASVPEQRLYHRMASGPGARWWLPLLATAVLIVIFLLSGFVAGVAAGGLVAVGIVAEAFLEDVGSFIAIAMMVPCVFVAARVWRRRGGEISSVVGRIRWKWLLLCAGVAAPISALSFILSNVLTDITDPAVAEPDAPAWPVAPLIGTIVVLLLAVPFQAAAEEYFTRGWIVQLFGAYLRTPWIGVGVGAVVFVALHGDSTIPGAASLLTFALVLGWLVIRTGGLEAGIAYHAVWNTPLVVLSVFSGPSDPDSNMGDAGWPFLVFELIFGLLYAFVVARLATGKRLGTA